MGLRRFLLPLFLLGLTVPILGTAPQPPAPRKMVIHLKQEQLDLNLLRPADWKVDALPNGFPMIYLPPSQGNTPDADWSLALGSNDIGPTGAAVVAHVRDTLNSQHKVVIDDTGTRKTADGLEAGYVRYHNVAGTDVAMYRLCFIIGPKKLIVWLYERAPQDGWATQAPALAAITDSVTLTPTP